jgi:putative flippase GtrA
MKTSAFARLRQRAVDMAHEKQFVRFLLVGTLNTGFSYLVYALLLLAGLHYAVANLGSVVLGIIFSFKTQGVLVFRDPRNALFARFAASWIVIYGANVALIALFVRLGLNPYVAGLAVLPIIVPTSYLVQKILIFRKSEQQPPVKHTWGDNSGAAR